MLSNIESGKEKEAWREKPITPVETAPEPSSQDNLLSSESSFTNPNPNPSSSDDTIHESESESNDNTSVANLSLLSSKSNSDSESESDNISVSSLASFNFDPNSKHASDNTKPGTNPDFNPGVNFDANNFDPTSVSQLNNHGLSPEISLADSSSNKYVDPNTIELIDNVRTVLKNTVTNLPSLLSGELSYNQLRNEISKQLFSVPDWILEDLSKQALKGLNGQASEFENDLEYIKKIDKNLYGKIQDFIPIFLQINRHYHQINSEGLDPNFKEQLHQLLENFDNKDDLKELSDYQLMEWAIEKMTFHLSNWKNENTAKYDKEKIREITLHLIKVKKRVIVFMQSKSALRSHREFFDNFSKNSLPETDEKHLKEYQDLLDKLKKSYEKEKSLSYFQKEQIKTLLKAALLRLIQAHAKVSQENDDEKAKKYLAEAIYEFSICREWFLQLKALKNTETNQEILKKEEIEEIVNSLISISQDSWYERLFKWISKGLAFVCAAITYILFWRSGDLSLENWDGFGDPIKLLGPHATGASNFFSYFNNFLIMSAFTHNLKELVLLFSYGYFLTSDLVAKEVFAGWEKTGKVLEGLFYAIGSTLIIYSSFLLALEPDETTPCDPDLPCEPSTLEEVITYLVLGFVILSFLMVSRFIIDSHCKKLDEIILKKIDGDPNKSWSENFKNFFTTARVVWGGIYLLNATISLAMGYATFEKAWMAFCNIFGVEFSFENFTSLDKIFLTLAILPLVFGIWLLYIDKKHLPEWVPEWMHENWHWLRFVLFGLCALTSAAFLYVLAVNFGPAILVSLFASVVASYTVKMIFKMLCNATIFIGSNLKTIYTILKEEYKNNPSIGIISSVVIFTLFSFLVLFAGLVFSAITMGNLDNVVPIPIEGEKAIVHPLYWLIALFSIINGANGSVALQTRMTPFTASTLGAACEKWFPGYNATLDIQRASRNSGVTFFAITVTSLLIIPALILTAVALIPYSLVYLACGRKIPPPKALADNVLALIFIGVLKVINKITPNTATNNNEQNKIPGNNPASQNDAASPSTQNLTGSTSLSSREIPISISGSLPQNVGNLEQASKTQNPNPPGERYQDYFRYMPPQVT